MRTSSFKVSRFQSFKGIRETLKPAKLRNPSGSCEGKHGRDARASTSWLVVIVRTVCRRGQDLVRCRAGDCIPVLVNLHPQAQAHSAENFLDLVQRLAAEVFRL